MTMPAQSEGPAPEAEIGLTPEYVRQVVDALDAGRHEEVKRLVDDLHAADVADLLALVKADERTDLIRLLGQDLDPDLLPELEADVRDQVLEEIDASTIAEAVKELDSDDAIYLLEDLSKERQEEILQQIPAEDRTAVELGLRSEEGTAGRLMQREFISVPAYWTVGQVIDYLRETEELPEAFYEVFVVDAGQHPLGTVPVSRVMRNRRPVMIGDIMDRDQTLIPIDMENKEIGYLFDQYHLISAAVVDGDNRIVGMLTVDDIVEVIREETEEDLLSLGGVGGDESLTDTVFMTTRRRFNWLLVNLVTAILASIVIGLFADALEEIVALAILMPIVASMGGNAATQTLTVAVRALATKDLTATNAVRIVWRETLVGGLNGFMFALIMGAIAALWFASVELGAVIGVAMIVNLVAAGLAGILVPIVLERLEYDPAISSTVFVTTVTDVVGFLVFLGLATWVLTA